MVFAAAIPAAAGKESAMQTENAISDETEIFTSVYFRKGNGTGLKKNYVLDTNVMLQDSEAIFKFEDNDVYIPYTVVDELDGLKNARDSETAYQARRANRTLSFLSENGDFNLPGGGVLHFIGKYDPADIPSFLDRTRHDHIILAVVKQLAQKEDDPTILVTNDTSMSIKARQIFQVQVENYKNQQVETTYTGRIEKFVSKTVVDSLFEKKSLTQKQAGIGEEHLFPNEFITLHAKTGGGNALAIYKEGRVCLLEHEKDYMSGIKPLNAGQKFAKEALMTDIDHAPLVILQGPAGTAKTFLSLAAGLQMVEDGMVRQVLLLRPQSFFDKEIGYLPGDEQEKIDPLIRPFWDNLATLLAMSGEKWDRIHDRIDEYIASDVIRAESFAYLRGRSITDSFIILDEAQNATRRQILGAITRAGIGSKIVLTGDPGQIDNPTLDKYTNGLTYAANCMKESPLCYQINFTTNECKRSALAKDAIDRINW